jgi:hypothetical protein
MTTTWYPANQTEMEWFTTKFCDRCLVDMEGSCSILDRAQDGRDTIIKEWVKPADANPTCTCFIAANPGRT